MATDSVSGSHYAVRHIERFEIGTPYPAVVERIFDLFSEDPIAGGALTIDRTGVGQPVVALFKDAGINAEIRTVAITTGLQVHYDAGAWIVPKLELVGVMLVLLQSQRITIASSLPELATLVR